MSQIKVGYLTTNGHEGKAYIEEAPREDGLNYGTNKHSDSPLAVQWTDDRGWVEVVTQELAEAQEAHHAKMMREW